MIRCAAVLLVSIFVTPSTVAALTAQDLRARIVLDGRLADFEADEWVLDDSTSVREIPGDSRWGTDNDIRDIAVTWDDYNLYVGVSVVAAASRLLLFLDTTCGGVADLDNADVFRRNVVLSGLVPNLFIEASRSMDDIAVAFADCNTAFAPLDADRVPAAFFQDGGRSGGFELAVPWERLGAFERDGAGLRVPGSSGVVRLVAIVTGAVGTGVGDAAPDPTVVLENAPNRVVLLNNHISLPIDADDDGHLDLGVAPRAIAGYAFPQVTQSREILPLQLSLEKKSFSPELGQSLRFQVSLNPSDYDLPVFVTARVFSATGKVVRKLFEEDPRVLGDSGGISWDAWDGKDNSGNTMPGGVYVLAVSGGAGAGGLARTVKAPFALVR